jgi:hypothetical protein
MSKTSLVGATGDDKVMTLGDEFRHIEVLDVDFADGVMVTRIILGGQCITLIGDPQDALKTYLGGQGVQAAH